MSFESLADLLRGSSLLSALFRTPMHIRNETPDDREVIHALVADVFRRRGEADLIDALRDVGDLALSLVAVVDAELAGHVALSHLKSPERALALAPVAVIKSKQRCGTGTALIRAALERASALGSGIVFVVGAPDYYTRFGFSAEVAAPIPCPYAGPHFMALPLAATLPPASPVVYAPAFDKLA
jgi:putative acetyltransferase